MHGSPTALDAPLELIKTIHGNVNIQSTITAALTTGLGDGERVVAPPAPRVLIAVVTTATRCHGAGEEVPLSDAEYRRLKQLAETRRLPESISLWQFVRYGDGTDVQHGWWVRLMLEGNRQGTFSLAIREEPLLRRPYTQKERMFRNEVRETGGIPTLNRLVAYFDEDPKGPRSMSLELGEAQGRAWRVNYIVSQDDRPRLIGKPFGGVSVQSFPLVDIGNGCFEVFMKIEAPNELPALQNASLQLWGIHAR